MGNPTLAERLGYGAEDRLLIVNCDDLGSSHAANVAIYRSMVYGVATSATLMVPCGWAREGVRMCKGLAVGVHMTLTSEYRGYRWRGLTDGKSLYDSEGFLPLSAQAALQRLDAEDARRECRAQLETALAWGVDVTHLDAHMGVAQSRGDLLDVFLDLAQEFRLPVRNSPGRAKRIGIDGEERARARGVLFNEHLVYAWPRVTRNVIFDAVPKLKPGVTEVFGHPVLDGEELRGYDAENADIRVHDLACFTDPAVMDLLDQHGVKRMSFRKLRELQRAGG